MPVSARPGLWCWPPCCVRWVAGFQTRLAVRECFQPSLLGIVPFALLLSWSEMLPFTVGALGCAALMGLGNGGVFKLVPQYFLPALEL